MRAAEAKRVAVLTGAGISAESGIATFRGSGGIWNNVPVEEVATPEAFEKDPVKVWQFYAARRKQAAGCKPNAGHIGLARIEKAIEDRFSLATQNVDGFHHAAGNRRVFEIHGNLWKTRCTGCGLEEENHNVPMVNLPPRCSCGAILRPAIVWFGESMPYEVFAKAVEAASASSLYLVVGTSARVEPAATLPRLAVSRGAVLWEINPEETPLTAYCERSWRAPAGEVMDEVANAAISFAEQ